jgi:hypothetical protein
MKLTVKNLKERDSLGNLSIKGKIILIYILQIYGTKMLNKLI